MLVAIPVVVLVAVGTVFFHEQLKTTSPPEPLAVAQTPYASYKAPDQEELNRITEAWKKTKKEHPEWNKPYSGREPIVTNCFPRSSINWKKK